MFNDQEKNDFCDQTKIRKADIDRILEELQKNGYKLAKLIKVKDNQKISKQYLLGSGGQANVFNGINIETGESFAIKISYGDRENYKQIKEEQEILKNIKCHQHIINVYKQILLEDIDVCIQILELCQMSLDEEIAKNRKNNQSFTIKEIANIIFFAINALYEIHTNNIIHFDIKPSNILKSFSGVYKLTDFGMARKLNFYKYHTTHFGKGTIFFSSPEQLESLKILKYDKLDSLSSQNEDENLNVKFKNVTDVFSMGVTLLGVIGLEMDFQNKRLKENIKTFILLLNILDVELRYTEARLRQKFIQNFDFLISIEGEIERIQNIIYEYDTKNYVKDKYYAYLLYSLSQSLQFSSETKYIEKAIDILEKIKLEEKIDQKLIIKSNFDLSLSYNERSFQILQNLNDHLSQEIAYSFFQIGQNLKKIANYEKALAFSQQSLEIRKIIHKDNHPDIIESINLISDIYIRFNNPSAGLEHAQSGLKIIESIYYDNFPLIASSYSQIGCAYLSLGINDKAYEYLQKELKMFEYLYPGNHLFLALSFNNLGLYFSKINKHEKSLEYHLKSLEMKKIIFSNQNDQISFFIIKSRLNFKQTF